MVDVFYCTRNIDQVHEGDRLSQTKPPEKRDSKRYRSDGLIDVTAPGTAVNQGNVPGEPALAIILAHSYDGIR
jgi:hypothetical protein